MMTRRRVGYAFLLLLLALVAYVGVFGNRPGELPSATDAGSGSGAVAGPSHARQRSGVAHDTHAIEQEPRRQVTSDSRVRVRVTGRIVDKSGKPVPHAVVDLLVGSDDPEPTSVPVTPVGYFDSRILLDASAKITACLRVTGNGIAERRVELPSRLQELVNLGDVVVDWKIPVVVQVIVAPELREALLEAQIRKLDLVVATSPGNPLSSRTLARTTAPLQGRVRLEATLSSPERIHVAVRPVVRGVVTFPMILTSGTFEPKNGVMPPIVFRLGSADFLVGQVIDGDTAAPIYNAQIALSNGERFARDSERSSPTGHFVLHREPGFDTVVAHYGDFRSRETVPKGAFVRVRFDLADATRVRVVDGNGAPIEAFHLRENPQLVVGFVRSFAVPDLPIHKHGVVAVYTKALEGKRWFLETAKGVCRVYWDQVLKGNPRRVHDITFRNETTGQLHIESSVRDRGRRYRSIALKLIGDDPGHGCWKIRYSFRLAGDGPWTATRLFPGRYRYSVAGVPPLKGEVSVLEDGSALVIF